MTTTRYYYVCPRGFANEITYIRVRAGEVAAVAAHFAGRKDQEFGAGNTDWDDGWTDSDAAKAPGVALSWDDYLDLPGV